MSSRKENAVNKKESTRGRAQKMEGIFKVVKSSEVSFRKKKFQNELTTSVKEEGDEVK